MLTGVIPTTWTPSLQAALRVITGLMFLEHGTSKMLHFPINDSWAGMYAQMGGMTTFTGVVELIGGVLFLLGAFTRITSFVLAGFMAVAFWMVHFGMSGSIFPMINQGEAAVFFCFVFLYFAAAGAGPFSVDASRAA
ncbi:MAG: DoxX family protein [Alphaproteobacteria bacterium]|nr:DoxX family protein [Alphaproteobacteria bacterium]